MQLDQEVTMCNASRCVKIIPFCAQFTITDHSASDGYFGVVGTITLRGQSAVVWFGWGEIEPSSKTIILNTPLGGGECRSNENHLSVGNGNPPMGSLSLSMPSKSVSVYHEIPSTQLLGGSSDEDMILGQQISSRLAKLSGWPVFVLCSLHGWGDDLGGGGISDKYSSYSYDVSPQRVAAMAEKEVAKILLREKEGWAHGI